MSLFPTRTDWRRAVEDLAQGLGAWHIWTLLAFNDIRQRYKRSRFGQFWITLSTGMFIGGIGIVYSYLFDRPVDSYVPYLSVNIVIWTLLAGIVTDSTGVFTQAGHILGQQAMPKTIFVMRVIVRQLIILAHNLVIIALVFALFGVVPTPAVIMVIPGLALALLASLVTAMAIGLLCTRFRDLPQIIQTLLQVAFFLTPVMWHTDQLGGQADYIVDFNPFAVFLLLVADPLHGEWPSAERYLQAIAIIVLMGLVAVPLFARFRARIVYWL